MRNQNMTNEEKNYNCIDAVKLIMAVLVIGCHTNPLDGCTNPYLVIPVHSLLQTAVLFFFLCTGFFLGKKIKSVPSDQRQALIRGALVKNIKLYVSWSAIYMPLALVYFYASGYSVFKAVASYLRGFLLVGQNYNSWMLWYLLSCIYALLFIRLLLKRGMPLSGITAWGGIVFLLGMLLTELIGYSGALPASVMAVRQLLSKTLESGRIFTGFFYLPMGMLLAERRPSPGMGMLLSALGFLGDVLLEGVPGALFRGLTAIGIFIMASGVRLKSRPLYPMLRQMSIVLYFLHMYVWTFYYTLVYGQKAFGMDSFLVTSLACVLIAYLVILFQRRSARS